VPSGDAQRVWFPEMTAELTAWWTPDVSWSEFAAFCNVMMEKRTALRQALGIKPPMMYCPKCNRYAPSDIPGISIRSALFALKKGGTISDEQFKEFDRSWKRYQRKNAIDGYGRKKGEDTTCCG
jgi:hypothetical protein